MKNSIYVIRNDSTSRFDKTKKYIKEYKLDGCIFSATWTADLSRAMEFDKQEATSLATRLNNSWNGLHHKALQKCKCKA